MYYVYLLQSIKYPAQKYIGQTDNLQTRLEVHNSGGSIHTKAYRPWKVHMFLVFQTKEEAIKFEQYLKSGSGRAFAAKRFWSLTN